LTPAAYSAAGLYLWSEIVIEALSSFILRLATCPLGVSAVGMDAVRADSSLETSSAWAALSQMGD
jgi:hypothetical protein